MVESGACLDEKFDFLRERNKENPLHLEMDYLMKTDRVSR